VASLALRHVGVEPILGIPASTDANVAISLGIPALTLGPGGASGENHTVREWYDPTQAHRGVQKNLLAVLALVGVVGVMPPVLRRRAVAAH
jgi:tripeptide aminopeptidase